MWAPTVLLVGFLIACPFALAAEDNNPDKHRLSLISVRPPAAALEQRDPELDMYDYIDSVEFELEEGLIEAAEYLDSDNDDWRNIEAAPQNPGLSAGIGDRDVHSPDDFTITILAEQTGHVTLNPQSSSIPNVVTHLVTVVDIGGHLATLIPTTDQHGHSIMVTKDSETSPASQVIPHSGTQMNPDTGVLRPIRPSSSSKDAIPTPRQSTVTKNVAVYKSITTTVYKYKDPQNTGLGSCPKSILTETVAHIGDALIPLTAPTQTYKNGTVIIVAPTPEAVLHPLINDPLGIFDLLKANLDEDVEIDDIFGMNPDDVRAKYSRLDWPAVEAVALMLRARHDMLGFDPSLLYAVALMLRSENVSDYFDAQPSTPEPAEHVASATDRERTILIVTASTQILHNKTMLTIDPATMGAKTVTIADLGHTTVRMTQPTQTLPDGRVLVADPKPTPQYHHFWDPHSEDFPSCRHAIDRPHCQLERCMWQYQKPINITTVFPAAMVDPYDHSHHVLGYFTQSTSISGRPHWGTTRSNAVYWPLRTSTTLSHGTLSTTVTRETPPAARKHHNVAGKPKCWDYGTCQTLCKLNPSVGHRYFHGKHIKREYLVLGAALAGLIILLCLACCWVCCSRKHKERKQHDLQRERKDSAGPSTVVSETIVDPSTGHSSSGAPAVLVTSAPGSGGQAGNQAGGASAAGTEARQYEAGDGRGTLGRQAEEGRGRVHFGEGTQGASGDKVVQSGGPQTTEHVETVPAHQVDGAGGRRTGSEVYEMGSMRGRKRARPAVMDLI